MLLLPRGHCRAKAVAQHLGIDRRTINRYLSAEGKTFNKLVNDVRSELLKRYLESDSKPLSEVSALLGFSDASAFSRWHRNRFGVAARSRLERRQIPAALRR